MDPTRAVNSVSRRQAIVLLATMAAARSAGAQGAMMEPLSLDHVNIRVSSTRGLDHIRVAIKDFNAEAVVATDVAAVQGAGAGGAPRA